MTKLRKQQKKGNKTPNWRQYNRRLRTIHDTQIPSPDEDTKIRVKAAKDLNI